MVHSLRAKNLNGVIEQNRIVVGSWFVFWFVDWYKVEMGLILTPRRHFPMFYVQLLNALQIQTYKYPLFSVTFPYTHTQTNTYVNKHFIR